MAGTSRKTLAKVAGVVAGAAMVAVPITTTTASAAPSPEASASTSVRTQAEAKGMKFYDDYWTKKSCVKVGKWGLKKGKWTIYTCSWEGWDWNLYYDK
ncbi:hypothetical protein ACIBKX_20180 [Streptomyces sp. NPDC050658]|uniref:hypothetical protein n=1 Tax=unclassified Streptomyces TaxID=2593676 RepID=UPI0034403201